MTPVRFYSEAVRVCLISFEKGGPNSLQPQNSGSSTFVHSFLLISLQRCSGLHFLRASFLLTTVSSSRSSHHETSPPLLFLYTRLEWLAARGTSYTWLEWLAARGPLFGSAKRRELDYRRQGKRGNLRAPPALPYAQLSWFTYIARP